MANKRGAWIPQNIVESLSRLRLRPASHWQVYLVVLLTWCRYGGKEARLSIRQIAEQASLSCRTVQRAVSALVVQNLLRRVGRYEVFEVNIGALEDMAGARKPANTATDAGVGRANMCAPRRCQHTCASPTSVHVSKSKGKSKISSDRPAFTPKQLAVIDDVLREARVLLSGDAGSLQLPQHFVHKLGLKEGITYAAAFVEITTSGSTSQAGTFTAAVLALRSDPRVQGTELL